MDSSQSAEQITHAPKLHRLSASALALLYTITAGLWIWLSDWLILFLSQDLAQLSRMQMVKGLLFIGLTALLLYFERAWNIREINRAYRALSTQTSALRRANEELAEAQRVAKVGSWHVEVAGDRLFWSEETHRIFGVAPEDFDGRGERFYEIVHPDDVDYVRQADRTAIDNHTPLDYEHRVVHPDGSIRYVHERAYVTYDELGTPIRIFGMVQDITERRLNEAQLQQHERLAAIGQMAAGIAHDFNNILAVIMLYTQMLQLSLKQEGHQRHLTTIYQQAVHAANLVEQILDFSRRSSMERITLDMVPFVKEMVKLWQRTLPENIRIEMVCDCQSAAVRADPSRLQQALMNIVINARDAMPNGGLLRLELTHLALQPGAPPPSPGMKAGAWLRITVTDTGAGIPPHLTPRLFEPFFTTKPPGKGTGLGLAQVYGIVQQLEGHIKIDSVVDEGTRVVIYLPLLAQTKTVTDDATAIHPPHGDQECILLVEDEATLRVAIEEMLSGLGYQVITARDGHEALALYAEHGSRIALVLSDVVMPDMGGLELYHELKRRAPDARVLLATGYAHDAAEDSNGTMQWIQKPFTMDVLARRVAEAIQC